jgi:hypothetical protein
MSSGGCRNWWSAVLRKINVPKFHTESAEDATPTPSLNKAPVRKRKAAASGNDDHSNVSPVKAKARKTKANKSDVIVQSVWDRFRFGPVG